VQEPRYSQSLERGLAVLGCFSPERPVLGIADISNALKLSRSTTHRYVSTLFALGYLNQDASRRYRLGRGVTDLGMLAIDATGLREHAANHLAALRRETSHTANLSVLDGSEIVYIERARSYQTAVLDTSDLGLARGSRLPAHCTAMGKVLLASLPEHQQSELVSKMKLTAPGPNTITSKTALRVELEAVESKGFAVEDEELAAKLVAIAVPLRADSGEVVAAIDVAAHTSGSSLQELADLVGPRLVVAAHRIAGELGYHREHELRRSRDLD
jgi:IclR family transcriptional regulator, pca regulon regulatory protein